MDLERLNTTELVTLCHRAGFRRAHRGLERDQLIRILEEGDENVPVIPLEEHRVRMRQFLDEYEDLIRTQLPCDTDCPNCPDAVAAGCWKMNSHLYRRKR